MLQPRHRCGEVMRAISGRITPSDLERVAHASFADGVENTVLELQDIMSGERMTTFLRENGKNFPALQGENREQVIVLFRTTVELVKLMVLGLLAEVESKRASL